MYFKIARLASVIWLVLLEGQVEGGDYDVFSGKMDDILAVLNRVKAKSNIGSCDGPSAERDTPKNLFERGEMYRNEKIYADAIKCFSQCIENSKYYGRSSSHQKMKCHRQRAYCYEAIRDFKAADEDLLTVVKLQSTNYIDLYSAIRMSFRARNYDSVIENTKIILPLVDGKPPLVPVKDEVVLLNAQARILKTGLDPCVQDEIVEPGKTAVFTPDRLVERGDEFQMDKNYEKAMACFDKAIAKGGDVARYYTARGTCFMDQMEWQNAEKDFQAAVTLEPENVLFRFYLGYASLFLEHYDLVIQNLETAEKILEKKKDDPEIPDVVKEKIPKLLEAARDPEKVKLDYEFHLFLPKTQ